MYAIFYGLRERPFTLSPDPQYLFLSDSHREALAHLLYGIENGEGFIAITGEVGTGKTTLSRTLLQRLGSETEVAFIFNPELSSLDLLQAIHREFGLDTENLSGRELNEQLNEFLLKKNQEKKRVLLIIDEAQNLPTETLEQIRLLSNLETNTSKLLQIILLGQPELEEKLNSSKLRQLRQRITVWWRLTPLSGEETRCYIEHRIRIAAGGERAIFSKKSMEAIHRYSQGIPRLINVICDRALLNGYAEEQAMIPPKVIHQVIKEISIQPQKNFQWTTLRSGPWVAATMAVFCVGLMMGGFFHFAGPSPESTLNRIPPSALEVAPAQAVTSKTPPASLPVPVKESSGESAMTPRHQIAPEFDFQAKLSEISPAASYAYSTHEILEVWNMETEPMEALSFNEVFQILQDYGFSLLNESEVTLQELNHWNQPTLMVLTALDGAPRLVVLQGVDDGFAYLGGMDTEEFVRVPWTDLFQHWTSEVFVPWVDFENLPSVLRPELEGESIFWLQSSLQELGFFSGSPDGVFDEETITAVRSFQETYSITIDGTVGPLTKMMLYQELEGYDVPTFQQRGLRE